MRKIIGYTQGTFDLFHIGHLNLLIQAKKNCDYLIVGVNSNKLVETYKAKRAVIDEKDRAYIISHIDVVDEVIISTTLNKLEAYKNFKFDKIFIGDDWKGNERWQETEKILSQYNSEVCYLHHTDGVSSTKIAKKIKDTK